MKILIDADACPKAAKEILYKTSKRLKIDLLIVANQYIRTPPQVNIKNIIVSKGYNTADDEIVKLTEKKDIVITSDIPLADRIIKKQAHVLSPRGEIFDEDNIGGRLATRNLMEEVRNMGIQTAGPSTYNQRNKSDFANSLNKLISKK